MTLQGREPLPAHVVREFREGFYRDRLAGWIEDPAPREESSIPDVSGHLAAIADGQRDFSYPGHDRTVHRVLTELVRTARLRTGADIGCATGCFPAMQLATGIERCAVYEVRPTVINHPRIEVRVHDLSASPADDTFDLVTCLSTIEHVGLGRYGDPIDPWGDVKLAHNLRGLLRPGGFLVISFPVGPGCIVYDKHRIYSPLRRSRLFEGFELVTTADDRSLPRRLRWIAVSALRGRRLGRLHQPVYVLRSR